MQVGIIGFGGMGHVHAARLAGLAEVKLSAVADVRPEQLSAKSLQLNLGASGSCELAGVDTYGSGDELLAEAKLDVVHICLPTDLHAEYAIKAMEAGCHVLCEKPMARSLPETDAMLAAVRRTGRRLMIGQCLRFWPCYQRIKAAYESGEFGPLRMLAMRRVSGFPGWSARSWFADGRRSGGALLDLHVHDTDFVNWLLGCPTAVSTRGVDGGSGAIDCAATHYHYPAGPVVMAETSWNYGGGFNMAICATFEQATLEMGYRSGDTLLLRPGQPAETLALPNTDAYAAEIAYFLDAVRQNREPEVCRPESTRDSLRIALAEEQSALAGGAPVSLSH